MPKVMLFLLVVCIVMLCVLQFQIHVIYCALSDAHKSVREENTDRFNFVVVWHRAVLVVVACGMIAVMLGSLLPDGTKAWVDQMLSSISVRMSL